MSEKVMQEQLKSETRRLLEGPMKHVRAAALAAVLVPLATIAVASPLMAADCGGSGQPPCQTPEPASIVLLVGAGLAGAGVVAAKKAANKDK